MKKNTHFFGFTCSNLLLLLLLLCHMIYKTLFHNNNADECKVFNSLGLLLIKLCLPHPLLTMILCVSGTTDLYRYSPINIVSFGVNNVLLSSSNRNYAQSVLHAHTYTCMLGSAPYYVLLLILSFFSLFLYFPFAVLPIYVKQVTDCVFFLFTTKCYDNFRFHF